MTRTLDHTGHAAALSEPGSPSPGPGGRRAGKAVHWRSSLRHHRVLAVLSLVLAAVLVLAAGALVYQWRYGRPHEVSASTALQRYRAGQRGPVQDPGALDPAQGVYSYTGRASEHISFPPLSHTEGPRFPGTVTYLSHGCWVFRVDYSTLHWQNNTYCVRSGNLVESGRAGWYRWVVGTLSVSDTATFTCQETMVSAVMSPGETFAFDCKGTNSPIDTDVVDMSGTNEYVGLQTLHVAGTTVVTLHFHEVATLSGGQSGTSVADTWLAAGDGLPVYGTWSTTVRSPSPLGTSTLTGSGSFTLSSLTPRT